MKRFATISIATLLASSLLLGGCIDEVTPQSSSASGDQVSETPGALDSYVEACTSTFTGTYPFGSTYLYDFGLPALWLERDLLGMDFISDANAQYTWWKTWYTVGTALGPRYLVCQIPWTYYYKWINNCNLVLGMVPAPEELASAGAAERYGAGIAYAVRAMCYMDLARMFQYTYKGNEDKPTVPKITEKTTSADLANNPRVPNRDMWAFILEDLNNAEAALTGYKRTDKTKPDLSVVYGLKARAYLTMELWSDAERYAKLAQEGYRMLTESEWLDPVNGFNNMNNDSWMWAIHQSPNDANIKNTGGMLGWASQMVADQTWGYNGLGGMDFKMIDAHLFSTISKTDFRRKAFLDPENRTWPSDLNPADYSGSDPIMDIDEVPAYTSFKFRPANKGYFDGTSGAVVDIPMMRVEEMVLIEAEAAGMQEEARGRQLLEAFALTRDPNYRYDASLSCQDNVWQQRRIELWGEGFATFDIKRLRKGIIRSYAGTNHTKGYRYNTQEVPHWMNLCIVQTESNYNLGLGENNPTPVAPDGDSPEYVW